jgi:hypothetical protein
MEQNEMSPFAGSSSGGCSIRWIFVRGMECRAATKSQVIIAKNKKSGNVILGRAFAALQKLVQSAAGETQRRANRDAGGNVAECRSQRGPDPRAQNSNHAHLACTGAD